MRYKLVALQNSWKIFPKIELNSWKMLHRKRIHGKCLSLGWEATKQVILPVDSTKHICGCGEIC
jgi:hypothetical protein